MPRTTSVSLSSIIALLVAAAGCAGSPPATGRAPAVLTAGFGAEVREGTRRVRSSTTRFADLDSAVAAGYARDVAQCFSDPHHGAMGYHHLNRALVDATVEVERPEILLFERRGGRYVLNGVEFIIPYSRWPRDSIGPTIMGQALKRSDELRLWYLHMWVWTSNPAGLFADWNPNVHCP